MNKNFYNRVINLIPSQDLKNFVKSANFKFTDGDLLKIITDYSYDFQEKTELLEIALQELNGKEERAIAKRQINSEKKIYAAFMQDVPDTVYETEIKIDPDDTEVETYITASFEDALLMIKSVLKCYGIKAKECTQARYTIKKKTARLPDRPIDIYNNKIGTLGVCVLDFKYKILQLEMYGAGRKVACKNGAICGECRRCTEYVNTRFPHFLNPYDLVAYYDDFKNNPTRLIYGIFDSNMETDDSQSHIVLIEGNEYIQKRNIEFKDADGYYRVYDEHWHPSYFEIIKPETAGVPQQILDDYAYAVEKLKKIDKEINSL